MMNDQIMMERIRDLLPTELFGGSKDWRFSFSVNPYHIDNPPSKFFQIYHLFGKYIGQ